MIESILIVLFAWGSCVVAYQTIFGAIMVYETITAPEGVI